MCVCARAGAFFQCEMGSPPHALTFYGPVGPDNLGGGVFPALPTAPVAPQTSSRLPQPQASILYCTSVPRKSAVHTLSPFWATLGSLPAPTFGSLPGPISRQLLGQCKTLQKIYEEQ